MDGNPGKAFRMVQPHRLGKGSGSRQGHTAQPDAQHPAVPAQKLLVPQPGPHSPPLVSFPWSFLHPWVPTRRGWQASERADKLGQRDTAAEYFIALPALTFRSIELPASFNTSKAVQGGHRAALYVSAAKGNGQERSAQPDRAQQLALAPLLLGGFIRINLLPGRRSLLIAW